MTKRQYRARPLRGRNKQHTINEPSRLLDWITTYSFMLQSPQCWFANWTTITHDELQECYEAGFRGFALALGYQPYAEAATRPHNIDILAQPVICAVGKAA